MGCWSSDVTPRVKEFVALFGVSALFGRFGVSTWLVRTLWVILVAADHGRSLHRPRPPCYLPNLTLYEPSLLTALGKFPVKPLKALLLDVQPVREGVEAFERSVLEPVLELVLPGFSGPPHRQGNRTLLLDGLSRIEELSGATRRARASFPRVPKCERPILPVSMPETVVRLRPASQANLAWVHIRKRRAFSTRLPMSGTLAPHL